MMPPDYCLFYLNSCDILCMPQDAWASWAEAIGTITAIAVAILILLYREAIEDFRWHDLRHTWASWHVQSGTSHQELMELGSWTTFEMVMRYAHLAADHLRTAACRIDGTFTSQSAKVHHLRAA